MGFRIADGFVEIHGEIDKNQIRGAATKAGQDSGDAFSRAMGKKITQDLHKHFDGGQVSSSLVRSISGRGDFELIGGRAGRGFLGGFSAELFKPNMAVVQAMRTGVPAVLGSPAGLAGAAVAGVFVTSFVSAVVSSAALLGLGAGLVGVAAAAVRKDKSVVAAWDLQTGRISDSFTNSARSMVEPFRNSIDQVGDDFVSRLSPKIQGMFRSVAPSVEPLFQGLTDAADRFLSTTGENLSQINSFLIPASQQFPRLAEAAGHFFDTMNRNSGTAAQGFENIVDTGVVLIDILDDTVVAGTRMWNTINDVGPALSGLAGIFQMFSREADGGTGSMLRFVEASGGVLALWGMLGRRAGQQ